MKILLISASEKSIQTYKHILDKHKFECIHLNTNDLNDWRDTFAKLDLDNVKALIFDRVAPEIDFLNQYLSGVDIFFVIENWNSLANLKCKLSNYTYRFYLWPVNYALLIDDITSICKFKDYVVQGTVELGNVFINLNSHAISDGKKSFTLKNKEFELLVYMARHKGKVLSRVNILENVWDMNSLIITNTVDVHVSKLRRILKENFGINNLIKTIPCSGYLLG